MKKVLKSRIFIVLICGIIFTSLGVYGATVYPYKANEISYNPSNGEPTNVNDALNYLYNNIGKCSVTDKFRLGDYVQMTPTSTSYTIEKASTGYTKDQTINPSELNLWRIIKINDDGTMEMISENVSSVAVYFQGKKGYLNFVGVLNEIASQYENSNYTIDSRIMGYNGQTEILEKLSNFKSGTKDNSNEALGGGDIMYSYDTDSETGLVYQTLGTLVATNPSGTKKAYWLGSRVYYYDSSSADFTYRGRYVNTSGNIAASGYFYAYADEYLSDSANYTIRPILTLKSEITVTGSGTRVDPWVLE